MASPKSKGLGQAGVFDEGHDIDNKNPDHVKLFVGGLNGDTTNCRHRTNDRGS